MPVALRRLVLASLLFLAGLPAFAEHHTYSALYLFGDSYVDVGNIYLATNRAEPLSPPYYMGQFSNGPIWVEYVGQSLGLTVEPSLVGGTDYGFGGALVTAPFVTPLGTVPSVPQQVGLYLNAHGGKADPDALYVIEGGGNDILAGSGNPETLGFKIAAGIGLSELALRQAGARHFLIPNLVNVGLLPAAAGNASFASAATQVTNQWVNVLLGLEEHLEGVHILRVNAFKLLNEIEEHPARFGFVNVTTPCLTTTTECGDPSQTLFWDAEHLTEAGQLDLAAAAEAALED
jgi:phospholipase/lecithinase/hemolysin